MKRLIILMLLSGAVIGQDIPPVAEQIAAAVLAAPAQFRAEATVMGYDETGKLVVLRKGSNQMTCLADDPAKEGFSVAAYHNELEPFMSRGRELRAAGKSSKEIFEIREAEATSGQLKMPENGATLHILYGKEAYYDADTGQAVNAIYRAVVYLPWATPESTGLPLKPETPGAPWIMDPGTHRAHIMINPPATASE